MAKRTNERLKALGVEAVVYTVEYADDCTGVCTGATEIDLQIALIIISEEFNRFYCKVGLKQNCEKSEILPVRRMKKSFELQVGDVKESEKIKLLGLTVQAGLRFEAHIENVSRSVRAKIHELYKVQHVMSFSLLKRTVEALCLSKIFYAMEIYNNTAEISKSIQRLMNIALCLVCHGDMRSRVSVMLEKTGWLNSTNKTALLRLMMLRKILLTRACPVTWSKIRRGSVHHHNTRDVSINLTWNPISAFSLNSFLQMSVKLWNLLQLYTWNILSKSSMKKNLPPEICRRFGNSNL